MKEYTNPNPTVSFNRLVKVDLRTIEPQQFEASFSYKLGYSQNGIYYHPNHYQAESYLFFPAQMKVNPASYPVEHFYRDMKSYINFRIPKLSFREMIGLTDNPNRSPLGKIKRELSLYASESKATSIAFIRQEARIFGCAFHNFLERKLRKLERRVSVAQNSETAESSHEALVLNFYHDTINKIYKIFKEWQKLADPSTHPKPPTLQSEVSIVDEYIVHITKDFLLQATDALDRLKLSRKTRFRLQHKCRAALRGLRMYCRRSSYIWIDDRNSAGDLEDYQYRRGLLKRKVWSSLYLDPRVKPLFAIQKQAGAMLAAGAAAIWAFLAEVTIRSSSATRGSFTASIEGSTFIIITAFALAYILKDRIKELGRGYFKWGIFGRLPDSSNKIIYPKDSSGNRDVTVGNYEEKARFSAASRLPEDIAAIADRYFPLDEEESRSIILYQQRFSLKEEPIRNLKRKMRAVYSFYRLNISSLLGPLDQPDSPASIPTQDLHITKINLPKVYHVDLIIKITGKVMNQNYPIYRIFRLVVNKEGILRLENWSAKLNLLEIDDRDNNKPLKK